MDAAQELKQEQEYTAMVQQLLYAVVNRYKEYSAFHDESIRMMLSDAWEELRVKPTALSPQDLEQLSTEIDRYHARKTFTQELARRYERMLLNPFFARVDFRENGEKLFDKIVIGLYSLKNQDGTLLVHDWRAPICSLYYEAMPGEVSFDSPSGKISGYMIRKRQYRMENGKLRYFVDTDLSIDDSMLLDILSGATSSHMRNIVSTIQKEQNAAIRYSGSDVLSVVGSAGSGKTSVAMHRAAYLMYHQRDKLDASRITVVSPGAAFTEYISNVLLELGEDNTQNITLHELYKKILHCDVETSLQQQNRLLAAGNELRRKSVSLKSDSKMSRILARFAERFATEGPAFSDITLGKSVLATKTELENMYRVQFRLLNPSLRLVRMKTVMESRLENWTNTLSQQYEDRLIKDYRGKDLELAKRVAVSQRLLPVRSLIKTMLDADPLHIYAAALSELPEELRTAAEENAKARTVWWEDAPAIVWLMLKLGFVTPDKQIYQLLIDEAQDYSDITLRMLRLYYSKASVTLLGDPNQRTCPAMPECVPEEWGACFGKPDAPLIKLEKCYRSTLPITRLCNAVLPGATHSLPVGREGDWPVIERYSKEAAVDMVRKWQAEGVKSIAIITRTQGMASRLAKEFPEAFLLEGDGDDMLSENGGIVAGSYSLMKGLEFDACCVVWPEEVELTEGERRRLYTSCSRALHKLALFGSDKLIAELGIVL